MNKGETRRHNLSKVTEFSMIVAASIGLAIVSVAGTDGRASLAKGEIIHNGGFENGNDLEGWSPLGAGGTEGEIALDSSTPLNKQSRHSLRITVRNPLKRCGAIYSSARGINFEANEWYDFTFCARTDTNKHFGLVVSMEGQDGQTVCGRATIPEVGGDWAGYTLALSTRQSVANGRVVITMCEPGTVWLDDLSLILRKSLNGTRRAK